jgi:5-methylcytosine-specific restriction protein A
MEYSFYFARDKKHISAEKRKAQALKKSRWWKQQIADGVCYYCKRAVKPGDLTMDHIVPIARGGKSTKGNVVPCCKECNNKKRYFTPSEILLKNLEIDPKK